MGVSIPDKYYKLTILIGLILIGYFSIKTEKTDDKYDEAFKQYNFLRDSIDISELMVEIEVDKVIENSNRLALQFEIKNPIIKTDSNLLFTRSVHGTENEMIVDEMIYHLWIKYIAQFNRHKLLEKRLSLSSNRTSIEFLSVKEDWMFQTFMTIGGILLLLLGIILWGIDLNYERNLKNLKNKNERFFSNCQSCGLKLNSMVKYGTNEDESENFAFCNQCFHEGEFTTPSLTVEDQIQNIISQEESVSWFRKRHIVQTISRLERWTRKI